MRPANFSSNRNVALHARSLGPPWFNQCQNVFEFVQKEHQPNAIYCKMMEHEKWAKYFTIECFSTLIKITQFYIDVIALYANVER